MIEDYAPTAAIGGSVDALDYEGDVVAGVLIDHVVGHMKSLPA